MAKMAVSLDILKEKSACRITRILQALFFARFGQKNLTPFGSEKLCTILA